MIPHAPTSQLIRCIQSERVQARTTPPVISLEALGLVAGAVLLLCLGFLV